MMRPSLTPGSIQQSQERIRQRIIEVATTLPAAEWDGQPTPMEIHNVPDAILSPHDGTVWITDIERRIWLNQVFVGFALHNCIPGVYGGERPWIVYSDPLHAGYRRHLITFNTRDGPYIYELLGRDPNNGLFLAEMPD